MESREYPKQIKPAIPKRRQDLMRWDGWGYSDSRFELDVAGDCYFTGNRYPIAGGVKLTEFYNWLVNYFELDDVKCVPRKREPPRDFPEPVRSEEFLRGLEGLGVAFSEDGMERLARGHGQTVEDVVRLRERSFGRIPDVVIWPSGHEQVVEIVRLAQRFDVAVIPVGGNSSVSGAATTPEKESRTIAALDMTQMNRILWLNRENLTARFEVGITGQDMERELRKEGLTMGHEPDSYEFSTLGGWISTRASGMKKNVYGNIEDLVLQIKMVTGIGVFEKQFVAPRVSCGPDLDHMVFGSEGTLGVITEATVKVRPLPEVRRYGSLVVRDFETGVEFLREIASKRLQPASIRLMDNRQFQFGHTLQLRETSWYSEIVKSVLKMYLTKICGFRLGRMAAVTLMFEGSTEDVREHERKVYDIAARYGAINSGSGGGEKGYTMTFVVAYIRDFGLDINIVGESFETSLPWDKCVPLCRNVKACVERECQRHGISKVMISSRVTQVYDAGCCVYFYMAYKFPSANGSDLLGLFKHIENCARAEILASGGTISHHHGVGKLRSQWYPASVSPVGVDVVRAVKRTLDPGNTFAAGNLLDAEFGEVNKCA